MPFFRSMKFRLITLGVVLIVVGVLVRLLVMPPAVRNRGRRRRGIALARRVEADHAVDSREAVRMHDALTARAGALIEDFGRGGADCGALFSFLAHDMVARHIVSHDRAYFPYLEAASSDRLPA